eukprot:g45528.t1
MGLIKLQNPSHPSALLHKANQMRLLGTLCDVVILVDSQEFHAHRTVLACTSKMFEILFLRNSQHYTLDFLSPKTFQQILEYAYTATLQAKVEDLDDLLYAAEILEIEYLEEQCLKILETIQATDDNDAEMTVTEDEDGGKAKFNKNILVTKQLSGEEVGFTTNQAIPVRTMEEQSPSVSTSFGLSAMSPTKAAVDSLMSIGQSIIQGSLQQTSADEAFAAADRHPMVTEVKHEMMQVEEGSSPKTGESGSSGSEKISDADRYKEAPGTPTRSSVITSARELHYVREENSGEQAHEAGLGVQGSLESNPNMQAEKHSTLYPVQFNRRTDGLLEVPTSLSSALHVQPTLSVAMDFTGYGGLLPQGLIQRELFNKLGELAAGMKSENRSASERCNVCGMELSDNEAIEQH